MKLRRKEHTPLTLRELESDRGPESQIDQRHDIQASAVDPAHLSQESTWRPATSGSQLHRGSDTHHSFPTCSETFHPAEVDISIFRRCVRKGLLFPCSVRISMEKTRRLGARQTFTPRGSGKQKSLYYRCRKGGIPCIQGGMRCSR